VHGEQQRLVVAEEFSDAIIIRAPRIIAREKTVVGGIDRQTDGVGPTRLAESRNVEDGYESSEHRRKHEEQDERRPIGDESAPDLSHKFEI
jgi:hypothetical protein